MRISPLISKEMSYEGQVLITVIYLRCEISYDQEGNTTSEIGKYF
jgi:hypothetical protein